MRSASALLSITGWIGQVRWHHPFQIGLSGMERHDLVLCQDGGSLIPGQCSAQKEGLAAGPHGLGGVSYRWVGVGAGRGQVGQRCDLLRGPGAQGGGAVTTYVHVCENQASQALIKPLKMSTVWVKSAFGVAGTGSGHWGAAGRRPGWMSRVRSWLLCITVTPASASLLYIQVWPRSVILNEGPGAVFVPWGTFGSVWRSCVCHTLGREVSMASSERGQNAAKQPAGHWAARLSAVLPRLCSPFQSLPCSVPRHTAHGTRHTLPSQVGPGGIVRRRLPLRAPWG